MTPCEKLGYKVGDRFKVNAECFGVRYSIGDVLVLTFDDGSKSPFFTNETTGKENTCCSIRNLEIIKEWNGEGLPPVGTVCEIRHGGFSDGVWEEVKVLTEVIEVDDFCGSPVIGLVTLSTSEHKKGSFWFLHNAKDQDVKFRSIQPKKTEAELMEEIFNKSGIQGLIDAGYHK
jgi:hypothetical protein